MKKRALLTCLMVFGLIGFANCQTQNSKIPKNYKFSVNIKGLGDTMLYLANYYHSSTAIIDSAEVTKNRPGTFTFKGKEALHGGIYILANQRKERLIEIIIDKNQNFSLETDTANLLSNITFKNSPENDVFYNYVRPTAKIQQEQARLDKQLKEAKAAKNEDGAKEIEAKIKEKYKEIDQFTKDFIAKNPEALISKVLKVTEQVEIPELPKNASGAPDSNWRWTHYKTHYWDNVDLLDERMLRTPVFTNKLTSFFNSVLLQDNDSIIKEADLLIEHVRPCKEMFKYIVSWIAYQYETSKIMGQDAIFVHIAEKYYGGNQCWWVNQTTVDNMVKRADQLKLILIGAKAQELIMPDTSGKVYLSSYTPRTKFTIMWFWDSDCGHCKIETPKLRDFYNAQKDSLSLEVFAICSDQDLARWKKFIIDQKLTWINVGGNTANLDYKKVYDIISFPVMYILDEQKNIIAKRLSPDDLPVFFKQYKRMMEHKNKK
jgi:thiol-disulfide isomerase/thioredoxin